MLLLNAFQGLRIEGGWIHEPCSVKNAVHGILINGVWVQQPELVKKEVVNFFVERFTEQNHHRPTLDGVYFPSIDQYQRKGLIAPFSDIELKDAVWSCAGDKCPGPDGFK